MQSTDAYFARLYQHDDPYGYRDRWYEERKRRLLLACLPRQRFDRCWEPGCSNGELTATLAPRCDELLATDQSPRAVELAQVRVRQWPHVRVQRAGLPDVWPPGAFDLIVFSELGYFLHPDAMQTCAGRFAETLTERGVLIACHWRRPFAEAAMGTPTVHDMLHRAMQGARLLHYEDEDILLEAWSRDARSVATEQGLA